MNPVTIPRVPGSFLVGSLTDFRNNRLELFSRAVQEFADIGSFRIGPWIIVLANSVEYVHSVLVEQADYIERVPRLQKILDPVIGSGLLNSDGAIHRRQRKLVAPAFQPRHISTYAQTMVNYAERIQEQWVDGTTIDIAHEMMRLTLGIVGKTLFDADVLEEAHELREALTTAAHHTIENSTSLAYVPVSWPTPRNRRFRWAIGRLDETIYRMIDERRRSGNNRGDLLSMLLSAHDEDDGTFMTDRQVRDEAMTLFTAGHETMASALAWTWYLLVQHPAEYARMNKEITQVLGERLPTAADLRNLPFTLQVLKESMRLYPPVYIIPRYVTRTLQIGPYTLTPGTNVGVSPYVLHRRPDYFPDPERFEPDRFSAEREASLRRYAYLPFGAGPHICIGNHFALMEGQLVLATLAQRVTFDLVPGQDIEPEPLVTLRPRGGIRLVVNRRATR